VIRQQGVVGSQVPAHLPLDPAGHHAVQLSPLGERQQAVRRLLGNHVLEQVRQVWLRRLQQRQVLPLQHLQLRAEVRPVTFHGVHVAQRAMGEHPPDYAGHLQCELLPRGQSVDAAGDHPLHCIRDGEPTQVARRGREAADAILHGHHPGVAQGQR
jgi:hypothetical protein